MTAAYPLRGQNRPASTRQRSALAQLARQAFARQMECGMIEHGADFETWRAEESEAACGRRISKSLNGDYLRLRAHFLTLAGRDGEAFEALMQWQREAGSVAHYALARELARFGYDQAYADAISLDRFGHRAAACDVRETQWLAYTVRKNGLAKKRNTQTKNHEPGSTSQSPGD